MKLDLYPVVVSENKTIHSSGRARNSRIHSYMVSLYSVNLYCFQLNHQPVAQPKSLRPPTSSSPVNILSMYTPTLCSSAKTKD